MFGAEEGRLGAGEARAEDARLCGLDAGGVDRLEADGVGRRELVCEVE